MPLWTFGRGDVGGSAKTNHPAIQETLLRALVQTQKDLAYDTLRLPKSALETLAALLVELAEDLHCGIGLWRSLEQYHSDFFGTPLPFVVETGASLAPHEILPVRLQHFLWVMYPQFLENRLLASDHRDLIQVANVAAEVLQRQFAAVPRETGVKAMLRTPNVYGWDVKRKLIWLGTQSYLFREFFQHYLKDQKAKPSDIPAIDDFVCQNCTEWAGLGALEILAGVLDLPSQQRGDLVAWSQRHTAVFEVLAADQKRIEVLNLINDRKYRVRMNLESNPFRRGLFVAGSLVSWQGRWYWSGEQQTFAALNGAQIAELKQNFRLKPFLYYRFAEDELKQARKIVREQYEQFKARHGKDWVVFPDGKAYTADFQKEAADKFAALPASQQRDFLKRYGLKQYQPTVELPRQLTEMTGGVGVYFNPHEGQEILPGFQTVISGLEKKGVGLTPDEQQAIWEWIRAEAISPGFVRSLVEEYGSESIKNDFLMITQDEPYTLDYLLRRYKGHFYRTRYPSLTLVK